MSLIAVLLFGLGRAAFAEPGRLTPFDVPGAGTAAGQGTFPAAINALGEIAGYYTDANNVSHGFLRSPGGRLTIFDDPEASNQPGAGTIVFGMNLEGAIAGAYITQTYHGFVRSPEGKFSTVDWPGACNMTIAEGCHGSGVWNINAFGELVGPYEDTSGNFVAHTGIRTPDGKVTTYAVPGSSMEAGQGTLPASASGLNQWGAITGLYYDANNGFHGYLRKPDGTFVDFEAPGADITTPYNGTFPNSLSDRGEIAGDYIDVHDVYHGFIRSPEDSFQTFDAPGADTSAGNYNGTLVNSLNERGEVTGFYVDKTNVEHGFVRCADGSFNTFDAPGAGKGSYQGTTPQAINLEGVSTGYYSDGVGVYHGFVWKP